MTKMTAKQARDNFTDLLGMVYYGKKPIAVEKKGRVFAVVIHPDEYEAVKKAAKNQFFRTVDEIQAKNKDLKGEEVLQDVTLAVEKVRSRIHGHKK